MYISWIQFRHITNSGLNSKTAFHTPVRHTLVYIVSKRLNIIVMLSSPHDSLFILVLCVSRSSRNSDVVTPCGAVKQSVWKYRNFRPITCYISEMVEDRWVYAGRRFTSIVTFTAIVPGPYLGETKMCKKCAKMANFWTYGLNELLGNGWR